MEVIYNPFLDHGIVSAHVERRDMGQFSIVTASEKKTQANGKTLGESPYQGLSKSFH
jgi:hypothetical protein